MKKYLLTGLAILLPVVLTLIVAYLLFEFFSTPFLPIVDASLHKHLMFLPEPLIMFLARLIALTMLCVFFTLVGMLTQYFFFRSLGRLWDALIRKIPLVNTVYTVCNDFFTALFSPDGKKAFKETVMFPFPYPPHFAIGLLSGEVPQECQEKVPFPLASVFAPTAPHPISGFLFLAPKDSVLPVDMTKEDAVNYLVSCGVIHPKAETEPELNK